MLKYLFYALYNAIALLIIMFGVFYLNTFFNELLIPALLKRNFETEMVARFAIATIEGIFLIFLIGKLNRHYFAQSGQTSVATWTTVIEITIVVVLNAIIFYQIYQHDK